MMIVILMTVVVVAASVYIHMTANLKTAVNIGVESRRTYKRMRGSG